MDVAARDLPCEDLRTSTALRVELAELRDGLFDDFAAATNRANQASVRVGLAVLPDRRAAPLPHFSRKEPPSGGQLRFELRKLG